MCTRLSLKLPEVFSNYSISKMQNILEGLLKHNSDGNLHCFDRVQTVVNIQPLHQLPLTKSNH